MNKKMIICLIIMSTVLLIISLWLGLKTIKPLHFNLIVGIVIVIATIFGLFGKQFQDKSSSDKSDKILSNTVETNEQIQTLQTQNRVLEEKMEFQYKIVDKLREENTTLYNNLANASSQIYTQVTGGNSYCVIEPHFNGATNQLSFTLKHIGKIPLRNVQVTIEDEGRRAYLIQKQANNDYGSPLANQISKETSYGFEFNSINPNTIRNIQIPVENNQTEIRMRIWMFLDNGTVFEYLQISNPMDDVKRKIHIELKRGEEMLKVN